METTRTVEEIEIKSEESNESLRIQKKGEEWMLVSPVIWKAETLMISDLKTKLVHSDPVFVIDESELNERVKYYLIMVSTRIQKKSGLKVAIETFDSQ